MTFSQLLLDLSYGVHEDIIRILNSSLYAQDYQEPEKSFVVSTGFTCKTQHGKILHILYDAAQQQVLHQVYNFGFAFPPLCGALLKKDKTGFYNEVYTQFVAGIFTSHELGCEVGDFKNAGDYWDLNEISEISVYDSEIGKDVTIRSVRIYNSDHKILHNIPLQMKHDEEVFFTGKKFIIKDDPDYDDWYDDGIDPFNIE